MNLHKLILTENACYKAGRKITPKGIMVHSTGANNPWLKRYVGPDDGLLGKNQYNNHWNTYHPGGREVCVHAFIGKLADGSVATYQTLPWDHRGWHAGGSANNTHIGFEICEDGLSDGTYFKKVYQEAVELCAYNGNKYAYLFNRTATFDWTEFTAVIPDVQDGTLTVYVYNRLADLYLSDIILAEGSTIHKWTPAPNEIYTTEVKIDHRGIEVSNADSAQRTVINNTEFSGYYNEEKIFTLNKDETITKKTTVDGELTVGKTKFVPMPTASEGLNIVILD